MHTTTVNSKRISNDEDKMSFPLAAVTGTCGRSPVAFMAVSATQSQSYQVSGRMQREGGRRVGGVCVCGLQFLKRPVAGNFSFHLQAVAPCTFMRKGIPASNLQHTFTFTQVWLLEMFMNTANAETL